MTYPCTVNVSCEQAGEPGPLPFAWAVLSILALCLAAAVLDRYSRR